MSRRVPWGHGQGDPQPPCVPLGRPAAPLTPSACRTVPPAVPAPGPQSSPASSPSPRSCLRRGMSHSPAGSPPRCPPSFATRTRLEVPVDDAVAVEVAQPRDDLAQVVPHLRLRQPPPRPQDVGEGLGTERGVSWGPGTAPVRGCCVLGCWCSLTPRLHNSSSR